MTTADPEETHRCRTCGGAQTRETSEETAAGDARAGSTSSKQTWRCHSCGEVTIFFSTSQWMRAEATGIDRDTE